MTLALTLDPTLFVSALAALSALWVLAEVFRFLVFFVARHAAQSGRKDAR